MLYPVTSFACLAQAFILFPASLFTFKKLYQGSKSNFAYLLTIFTFAVALSRLVKFILYTFPNETFQAPNGYVFITNYYLNNLLSLQPWIFGIKYLWSGVLCSLEVTYISSECVQYIGWTGGLCFSVCMITCWCIWMVTFPGWTETKLTEWFENTFNPIDELTRIIFGVFNIVSTMVTIIGIYKIVNTLDQLKKYDPHLKTNY